MRFPAAPSIPSTLEARATGAVFAIPTTSKPAAKRQRSKRSATATARHRTTVVMIRQGQCHDDRQPQYRPDLRPAPR